MTQLQITYENPALLQENPWNPNEVDAINEEKLANSLEEFGLFKPILVRELEDGTRQILGGQHRNRAALLKGYEQVPVLNLGVMSDEKAKKIGLVDNGRYGEDDMERLAEVFSDLGDIDSILGILPMDQSDFDNIFSNDGSDLDLDELLDAEEGEDSEVPDLDIPSSTVKTHQIMRFKVAITDAPAFEAFIRKIQREQGFTESDALTNAGDALTYALGTHPNFEHEQE